MTGNAVESKRSSRKTDPSPLTGKLFDASGERLGPCHSIRNGRRYRYYVSQGLLTNTRENSVNGWRLPAQEIEQAIVQAVRNILSDRHAITIALQESEITAHHIPGILHTASDVCNRSGTDPIIQWIERVKLRQDSIRIKLSLTPFIPDDSQPSVTITQDIPMRMRRRGVEMRLVIGGTGTTRTDHTMIKPLPLHANGFRTYYPDGQRILLKSHYVRVSIEVILIEDCHWHFYLQRLSTRLQPASSPQIF